MPTTTGLRTELANELQRALADHRAGRLEEAEARYQAILAREPEQPGALHWLGVIAFQRGQYQTAVERIERALTIQPDYAEAHNNLGLALQAQNSLNEAIAAFRRALELAPDDAEVHNNLGIALTQSGAIADAIPVFESALVLKPDFSEAHFNRGLNLLHVGRFTEGWREYEWRLKCDEQRQRSGFVDLPQPRWDGRPFGGKTLLVHTEQGFGDTIHFARYVPMAKQRGGRVLLACEPVLRRLFETLPGGVDAFVGDPQTLPDHIDFDMHVPLPSLAGLFDTTVATIPDEVPYLQADISLAQSWRERTDPDGYNVGIVWAGKGDPNPRRSCTLGDMAALARTPSVRFYSMQKGPAAADIGQAPKGMKIVDCARELGDFADTAALIANLDLVISIDTAVAHLAGALGRPVWTLLSYPSDWRWLVGRDDSPWYPSMKLFRQTQAGDWGPVIQRVAAKLESARCR
ncbi:MAG: tetratricopeptide repeat protein [Acidiferrobacterales bacterium]